jgi:quinol monooxygenase YgiN
MAEPPWHPQMSSAPEREYLVLLSYLPLKSFRGFPLLLVCLARIRRQLRASSGLVGFSLRAELAQKRFWTLSAWEDEAALQSFVMARPHAAVMQALSGHMGPTRFTRWTVKGTDLPPPWHDALEREKREGDGAAEV